MAKVYKKKHKFQKHHLENWQSNIWKRSLCMHHSCRPCSLMIGALYPMIQECSPSDYFETWMHPRTYSICLFYVRFVHRFSISSLIYRTARTWRFRGICCPKFFYKFQLQSNGLALLFKVFLKCCACLEVHSVAEVLELEELVSIVATQDLVLSQLSISKY